MLRTVPNDDSASNHPCLPAESAQDHDACNTGHQVHTGGASYNMPSSSSAASAAQANKHEHEYAGLQPATHTQATQERILGACGHFLGTKMTQGRVPGACART